MCLKKGLELQRLGVSSAFVCKGLMGMSATSLHSLFGVRNGMYDKANDNVGTIPT